MDQTQNPVGVTGLEFIEFSAPNPTDLEDLFARCGFEKIGRHRKQNVDLFRQGRIHFVINREPVGFAADFVQQHGPSICAVGWRVKNAESAFKAAVTRGARPIHSHPQSHSFPAVYGIGESAIYFIDVSEAQKRYDSDFEILSHNKNPVGLGLEAIDHLTNNVPQGEMEKWCDFYEKIFAFHETRYFDIRGSQTGLFSKVMHSPCGTFSIPINEPNGKKSQIQEYLDEYHGPGIQHLALLTSDILKSVHQLRQKNIEFLETPDAYFDRIPERVPHVTEHLNTLKNLKILVDGDDEGYLLQIFTKNLIGPIFFEVIQRKNHSGFGNGNFQALFDAIEHDQKQRGYL